MLSPNNHKEYFIIVAEALGAIVGFCFSQEQVDAFSERKFEGNPAAVFFTQAGGDADWMQKVGKAVGSWSWNRTLCMKLPE